MMRLQYGSVDQGWGSPGHGSWLPGADVCKLLHSSRMTVIVFLANDLYAGPVSGVPSALHMFRK